MWGRTKIVICGTRLDLFQSSGRFQCTVCHTCVGSNRILYSGCKFWVYKKCSGLRHLVKDLDFKCAHCLGSIHPFASRLWTSVSVETDKFDVVASFCYLADMFSAADGCNLATIVQVKMPEWNWTNCSWSSLLATSHTGHRTRSHIYSACVQSCDASWKYDLAHDQAKPPVLAV